MSIAHSKASEALDLLAIGAHPDDVELVAGGTLALLRRAHALRPSDPNIMNNLGVTLLLNEERDEATRIFEQAALLHPDDASVRGISDQQRVRLHNTRGHCYRDARISDAIRAGVAVAINGYWAESESPVTINWTTSNALADVARQSSFQTNRVWIEALQQTEQETQNE